MKITALLATLTITLLTTLSVQAQEKVSTEVAAGFICATVLPCDEHFNVESSFLGGQCDQVYQKRCNQAKFFSEKAASDLEAARKKEKRKQSAQRAKVKRIR